MQISLIDAFRYNNMDFCLIKSEHKVEILIHSKVNSSSEEFDWFRYPGMHKIKLEQEIEILNNKLELFTKTKLWEVVDLVPIKDRLLENAPRMCQVVEGKPIVIVSASAKSSVNDTKLHKSLERLKHIKFYHNYALYDLEYHQIMNNSTGLSELYNRFLTDEYKNHIVIYVHDDVYLEDLFLFEKLYEGHKEFDVIGVAGSTKTTIKSPAYWHLMTERQNLRGFCAHQLNYSNQDISNMTVFGNSKLPVDLIDGVFMSVNVEKVLESNVTFDEDFDFHFYDLAFSKRVTNAGLRLGVWPIFITHFSAGGGNQRWKDLEPLFIQKYS